MLIVTGTISGCGGSILLHHFRLVHSHPLPYVLYSFLICRVNEAPPIANLILPEDLIRPTLSLFLSIV